ncbi:hypothetical protein E1262_26610 [Jiangella aurantiaca]|uniref:DUF7144 domain-containing protein n=2 Tax=Jiangella aurantiaca TaxID=2530373 RepID=A0A4R4ZZW1_9ACTN|nr:hypothetical protein E1262_26610 [Jiangella aurantiaca]
MSGVFQVIAGIVALFNGSYYAVRSDELLVTVGYTGWGWVHIIVGAAVALTGLAVMGGRLWAYAVCVALAVVSAIVNVGFLAAYPVGATITIALDVVVIFAITVHGREVRS